MKYRKFDKLGIQISALGFGAMRLPVINEQAENIDKDYTHEIMSHAFDNGINYVDTAYPYHDGNSETEVGNVLKNGYRDKVYLATKFPSWNMNTTDDFDKYLNEQLKKLQVEQIDFYLLHNLHLKSWSKIKNLKVLECGQKAIADGRIKYFGFSVHDTFDVFQDILDSFDWDMCQIQYNYMNEDVQVGTKGLKYAASKNIPVNIMEPLLGGTLANLPEPAQKLWSSTNLDPVDTAFQWLWDKPEVGCVLSGMNTLEQVKNNIKSANNSKINSLSNETFELIERVKKEVKRIRPIPCTQCRYCIPCPVKIDIPRILEMYNALKVHEGAQDFLNKALYTNVIPKENNADACIKCRKCESQCPQGIKISEWMPKIHEALLLK